MSGVLLPNGVPIQPPLAAWIIESVPVVIEPRAAHDRFAAEAHDVARGQRAPACEGAQDQVEGVVAYLLGTADLGAYRLDPSE
jgi:hypothetical protein